VSKRIARAWNADVYGRDLTLGEPDAECFKLPRGSRPCHRQTRNVGALSRSGRRHKLRVPHSFRISGMSRRFLWIKLLLSCSQAIPSASAARLQLAPGGISGSLCAGQLGFWQQFCLLVLPSDAFEAIGNSVAS